MNRERFSLGLSILEQRGFKTYVHPQTYLGANTGNQLAGTPQDKAAAFMDLWTDPKIGSIMVSCGGNFSSQFLHLLDFDKIAKTPKTLIGFSDTTALLSALYAKTGIGGIFGPTVQTLGRIQNIDDVFDVLEDKKSVSDFFELSSPLIRKNQLSNAPVFAATLSVLTSLSGTPYFPNLAGHILVLEDVGEELSRLDRLLWQLNQVSPFKELAGLMFGEFIDLKDTGRSLGINFEDITKKFGHELNTPIILNAPIGHGTRFIPVPIGIQRQT